MYYKDEGVLKDDKQAIKWYRKAADQGYADAQLNLGDTYANGLGVLKDLSKAKYWIKKAYENPKAIASTVKLAEDKWKVFELWKY
jgi:TPR repeat protein